MPTNTLPSISRHEPCNRLSCFGGPSVSQTVTKSILFSTMCSGKPPAVCRHAASVYRYKRRCRCILFHSLQETVGVDSMPQSFADGPLYSQHCCPLQSRIGEQALGPEARALTHRTAGSYAAPSTSGHRGGGTVREVEEVICCTSVSAQVSLAKMLHPCTGHHDGMRLTTSSPEVG
jgi:hypothetical protein